MISMSCNSDSSELVQNENAALKSEFEQLKKGIGSSKTENECLLTENRRLTNENAALKTEIAELKNEISGLKTENEFLLAENRGLTSLLPTPPPHLPWEILHSIFLRATVPETLLVPDCRSHSAWNLNTKTKLQLISVCKDWYEAGISLLYRDIAIYSVGQFCALISMLRRNPSLAEHVYSLRFSCYILSTHASLFERLIESLGDLCSKIKRFSFEESFLYIDTMFSACVMPSLAHGHSMLTQLELNVNHYIPLTEVLNNMYLFSERLESLIIRSDDATEHSEHLLFPLLQVFQFQLDSFAIAFITQCWEFPGLKTLACLRPRPFPVEFIAAHGKTLSTLLFCYRPRKNSVGRQEKCAAQEVIANLSSLRHLIIPFFFNVSAPQVHWLDYVLAVEDIPLDVTSTLSSSDSKARFPKLQCYRFLEFNLLNLPLIYVLLPPTMDEGRFNFPGVDIRCSAFALLGSSYADRRVLSEYDSEDELDFSSGGSDWTPDSESEWDEDEEEEEDDDDDDNDKGCFESDADEEMILTKWRARTDGF
ncbi:hypothetical protein BDP27DRAFT_1315489 [Rhodocollybia butyracea]|uniref:F-box domain-containing protein n=1 Tax=Rhodocollybia butyracea TaxID=206335 RepID=A0A9P5UCF8_9AGAR|nr:hypothetical protein BDP27DRAFT_1315489 [Rhodocollybia butyracea]